MKMLSRILVLVTLVCSYTINAQTVDEIIDNYFENTGGVENWEKIEGVKMSAKVNQGGMEIPIEIVQLKSGKMMTTINFQGQSIKQGVFDGEVLWSTNFMTQKADGNIEELSDDVPSVLKKLELSGKQIAERVNRVLSQPPILKVRDVKTHFPIKNSFFGKPREWVKAVDGVSFDVRKGETLGLVGESGCGKTTLGRTLLRLIEPTSGTIEFDGAEITDLGHRELRHMRKNMQIIFQDPYSSLNPRLTVGAAIMEPMKVHNIFDNDSERKDYVVELLEKVSMKEAHFYRYPHEFSGGQRQRISIARALAVKPKFIICDESVSSLDVSVQAEVLNLLNELRDNFDLTYIFISHDLSVVRHMSDRMVVMNRGKIEEIGVADEIYNYPEKEYTQKLISSIPKGEIADIKARIKRKESLKSVT